MKPEEFLTQTHADYATALETWRGMQTAYYGGAAFVQKFLWPYEGEEADDLLVRRQQAAYENHFQDIVERREALVYSRGVNRRIEHGVWQRIAGNADGRGTPWEPFIRRCFRLVQVFGFLPVLTDRPSLEAVPATRAQEEEVRADPYAMPILPLNFINWHIGVDGALEWCVIRSIRQESNDPFAGVERETEYRLITSDAIQVWTLRKGRSGKGKFELVDEIEHGLGRVPVVILNDLDPREDSIIGRPGLHDAVDLSVQLFNLQSWYTQLLYKTNFSTLAASPWGSSDEEKSIKVGPNYALWVPEGGITPEWVSPETGPADVFEHRTRDARRRIYELAKLDAGLGEDSARELSGEAYDRRHKPTEDETRRLGKRMEAFEVELVDLIINGWLRGHAPVEVIYPKRYGVRATADAIAQLTAIEHTKSLPQSVRSKLAAQIVFTEDFAELSDAEQDALSEEIRAYDPLAVELEHTTRIEHARAEAQASLERARGEEQRKLEVMRQLSDDTKKAEERQLEVPGDGEV